MNAALSWFQGTPDCGTWLAIVLAALNVALNTWLVHRRLNADRREYKEKRRGPCPCLAHAETLIESERAKSAPDSTP